MGYLQGWPARLCMVNGDGELVGCRNCFWEHWLGIKTRRLGTWKSDHDITCPRELGIRVWSRGGDSGFCFLLFGMGFPGGSDSRESACSIGDLDLILRLGRTPGEEDGNLFLTGEFHGQKSLVGYSSRGHKDSDTTEQLTLSLSSRGKWDLSFLTRRGTCASLQWKHGILTTGLPGKSLK